MEGDKSNSFYKNSRRQKIRSDKYKDKKHRNKDNPDKTGTSDSKPQRISNRRQPVLSVEETNFKPDEEKKIESIIVKTEMQKNENNNEDVVVVDHSHLKRETEEIDKLTQKTYKPRQITSNWEKYTIPDIKDSYIEEEYSEAADFSVLLQTPQSHGGHFKLKEEKDWCAESEENLYSFHVLDLNFLAQGLACIPFYQRHELATDLYSEEELVQMQNVAKQNENLYNNIKDSRTNTNTLTESTTADVVQSLSHTVELNLQELSLTDGIIKDSAENCSFDIDKSYENSNQQILPKVEDNQFDDSICFESHSKCESTNVSLSTPTNKTSVSETFSLIAERRQKSESENNELSKNEILEDFKGNSNKMNSPCVTNPKMDDDDELDFLLSLKHPLKESAKQESAVNPTKINCEVSFSGTVKPAATNNVVTSNLDDWLDSILDD